MNVTVLGIDLAKRVFQLHGVNSKGKPALKGSFQRTSNNPYIFISPLLLFQQAKSHRIPLFVSTL